MVVVNQNEIARINNEVRQTFKKLCNGPMDKIAFGKCLTKLDVHLKDPSTDVEAVFFAVDVNGNGLVSEEEFEAAVQPTIMERAEQGLPMILDEIVKDAFRKVIIESEVELAIVDEAFLKAHHDFVAAGKGFGVSYWGEHWRFQLFKDVYSEVRYNRLENLKSQLAKIGKGDKTWINDAKMDPIIAGELPSDKCAQAVAEYARLWLEHLGEVMEGAAKQKLAVDASNVADSTRVDSSG